MFEQALFDPKYRIYPEDFEQYTKQFVCNLKCKLKEVFHIDVCQINTMEEKSPVVYTEVFNLCRTTVLRHSEASTGRTSALLALYNSARLLGSILFLGAVGFLVRIFVSLENFQWVLIAIYFLVLWLPWIWIERDSLVGCVRGKSEKVSTEKKPDKDCVKEIYKKEDRSISKKKSPLCGAHLLVNYGGTCFSSVVVD